MLPTSFLYLFANTAYLEAKKWFHMSTKKNVAYFLATPFKNLVVALVAIPYYSPWPTFGILLTDVREPW